MLRPENREVLKRRGFVIYLRAHPNDLWLRIGGDKNRPLLQSTDPRSRLESLYELRDPLYRECAHLIVETGQPSVDALINTILAHLEMSDRVKRPTL